MKRDEQGDVTGLIGVIYDITARKEAELAILKAKEDAEVSLRRLDAVINTMQEGLVLIEPNGEVILFNPAALALHGYQSIEEIKKPVSNFTEIIEAFDMNGSLVPFSDWPVVHALRGEEIRNLQLKIRRKDTGLTFYGSFNIAAVKNQNGEVELGILTFRDVTSERMAEAELRASEERFSKAFNLSPLPKAITRVSDGQYIDVNDAFLKMSGFRREEVIGKTTLDLRIWRSEAERQINTKEIRDDRPLRAVDFPFRTKHGELRELRVSTEVVTLNGERCAISVMSDETERRRYERALKESEERLRLALEAAEIGTWDYDLRTDELHLSSRVARMFELNQTLSSSDTWIEQLHPSDRTRVKEEFLDLIQGRSNFKTEFCVLRTDGSERWIASRGALLRDDQGQPMRAIGISFDITGRKLLERQKEEVLMLEREANLQAQEASRLKDNFLLMLSHELRTPLNAILGWTTLLRGGRVTGDAVARALETIDRSARAQVQIISDLLDVSRVITGKLVLEPAQIHLDEIVNAAADAVRLSAEAKGVTLSVDLGQSIGEAYGDATRLQQVFWNLLSNAVKFTPSGGKVAVSLRSESGWAVLRVSDTGHGIPPE
ncbi:MAG TPA: PAS domain S-box protein, partial [Blastocatellia bacterium]|nr:PAS domain S-box protein [Blastocatellia bacterium]